MAVLRLRWGVTSPHPQTEVEVLGVEPKSRDTTPAVYPDSAGQRTSKVRVMGFEPTILEQGSHGSYMLQRRTERISPCGARSVRRLTGV